MSYDLAPLTQEYLDPAVELFINSYKQEQEHSPLLPSRVIDEPSWIYRALQSKLANSSVVVVEQNDVLAYMVTSDQFVWKGQQAAIVLEYCHSAVLANKQELYQRMYTYLAQKWADHRIHLHLIRHFAHDTILQETLYLLGFGAILAERLRDCSTVNRQNAATIRVEPNVSKLVTLQTEHNRYYPKAPIFIEKSTNESEVLADLGVHAQQSDVFFVYDEQDEPCAYMYGGRFWSRYFNPYLYCSMRYIDATLDMVASRQVCKRAVGWSASARSVSPPPGVRVRVLATAPAWRATRR